VCPSSRSRRSSVATRGLRLALLLLPPLTIGPGPAAAEARLVVSGSARSGDDGLELRVDLSNQGDAATGPLDIEGELLGETVRASLEDGIAPGASSSLPLPFELEATRPGVHPVSLLIEYPGPTAGAPAASQRAYLLVALGAAAEPAVRLAASPLRLETSGELVIGVESADAAPHRVRLRVDTPRGLRVWRAPGELDVPSSGRVEARVPLLRSGAARPSRHGIVVLAEAVDGELNRTTAATGEVEVAPDPARLPALRRPLGALAAALIALAGAAELRRAWQRRRPPLER
jgi:hypothetical protein